jgi:hypothetical protein
MAIGESGALEGSDGQDDMAPARRTWGSPTTIGLCLFLAIAGFFLWTEHRAHVLGILPYLILLACPLIHFFMHRGHGHGHGAARSGGTRTGERS